MAISLIRLFGPTQLSVSTTTLYTCPASPSTSVLKNGRIRLANTSGAAVAVTLYAVPNGGSSGPANCFLPAVSIPGGQALDVDIPTLGAGDALQGFAGTAASVTALEEGGILYS
jgi:hypothetical protein